MLAHFSNFPFLACCVDLLWFVMWRFKMHEHQRESDKIFCCSFCVLRGLLVFRPIDYLVDFCMSRVALLSLLERLNLITLNLSRPSCFNFWLTMLRDDHDEKYGIKHLASLQILCVVLWLQSGNVRAWLAALLLLLVTPQLSLDPPPNQVTT